MKCPFPTSFTIVVMNMFVFFRFFCHSRHHKCEGPLQHKTSSLKLAHVGPSVDPFWALVWATDFALKHMGIFVCSCIPCLKIPIRLNSTQSASTRSASPVTTLCRLMMKTETTLIRIFSSVLLRFLGMLSKQSGDKKKRNAAGKRKGEKCYERQKTEDKTSRVHLSNTTNDAGQKVNSRQHVCKTIERAGEQTVDTGNDRNNVEHDDRTEKDSNTGEMTGPTSPPPPHTQTHTHTHMDNEAGAENVRSCTTDVKPTRGDTPHRYQSDWLLLLHGRCYLRGSKGFGATNRSAAAMRQRKLDIVIAKLLFFRSQDTPPSEAFVAQVRSLAAPPPQPSHSNDKVVSGAHCNTTS